MYGNVGFPHQCYDEEPWFVRYFKKYINLRGYCIQYQLKVWTRFLIQGIGKDLTGTVLISWYNIVILIYGAICGLQKS